MNETKAKRNIWFLPLQKIVTGLWSQDQNTKVSLFISAGNSTVIFADVLLVPNHGLFIQDLLKANFDRLTLSLISSYFE